MRVFISQDVENKDANLLREERSHAEQYAKAIVKKMYNTEDVEFSKFNIDFIGDTPLYVLSKDVRQISNSDAAYFVSGWKKTTKGRIEHDICKAYKVKILKD